MRTHSCLDGSGHSGRGAGSAAVCRFPRDIFASLQWRAAGLGYLRDVQGQVLDVLACLTGQAGNLIDASALSELELTLGVHQRLTQPAG